MKKILFAAIILLSYEGLIAQTPEDALRYSWLQGSGTARSQAIANANGAIGGEISTIFSNPGNIGFYKTGDFVITGGLNLNNNTATYFNQSTKENNTSGFLGTTGFVLGKQFYGKGSVKSSAFGIAINRTADFNNSITYRTKASEGGTLVRTSMADYFIDDLVANGNNGDINSQLALDVEWVKSNDAGDLSSSAVDLAIASGIEQQQTIKTNGGITELGVSGALNLNDKIYIGGTIGMPILRYGSTKRYAEQDPDIDNGTNGFDAAWLDEDLVTKGAGINIKAGIVFKATDNFRVGFAAHSPTFYTLEDSYWSRVGTNLDDELRGDFEKDQETAYNYTLQTPYKLLGSFSLLFGNVNDVSSQKGFLSGDVEYVNYMTSAFRNGDGDPSYDNYYKNLNIAIDDAYKGAVNARLGAELKFNTFMFRLGGAYYGNPYKDLAGEEGQIIQATSGLGYRNKGFFIDLGYVHSIGKDVVFPYRLTSAPFSPATIKNSNSRILLTLGFKI